MLQVGEMVAEAALARRESRGGHYRVDYPDTRRRWQACSGVELILDGRVYRLLRHNTKILLIFVQT